MKIISSSSDSNKLALKYDVDNETGFDARKSNHGTGVLVTVLFIAGETAGGVILALPYALKNTGWLGLPLMIITIFDATVSGILIGKCWLILGERWPAFKEHSRTPYPDIGRMAYGSWMSYIVTACLQISIIGTCVVENLICAELVSQLGSQVFGIHILFSEWLLLICTVLIPFMWLGSPGDMWWAGAAALGTTVISVCLIFVDITHDYFLIEKQPEYSVPSFASISLAFGTFLYSVGSTATFPTFQNAMKDKSKFTLSLIAGNTIVLVMYSSMAVLGFYTYGGDVKPNITSSIPDGFMKTSALLLLSSHLIFGFIIYVNGALQGIEEKLKVPTGLYT